MDDSLTKERIKAETKAIVRCKSVGIRTPAIYLVDFERRMVFMEHLLHSITLKDFIETTSFEKLSKLAISIGTILGRMHEGNIIHGDLTSSNILLMNVHNKDKFDDLEDLKIDFGLSHVDCSAEDKRVDLYVLERALVSTHAVADQIFPKIIENYSNYYKKGFKEILAKYEGIRARGRKRTMVG